MAKETEVLELLKKAGIEADSLETIAGAIKLAKVQEERAESLLVKKAEKAGVSVEEFKVQEAERLAKKAELSKMNAAERREARLAEVHEYHKLVKVQRVKAAMFWNANHPEDQVIVPRMTANDEISNEQIALEIGLA